MRKPLAIGATLIVALAAPSAATAQNRFAVGSAKTEVTIVVGAERASFSAHNVGGLGSCEATGQIVYKNALTTDFTAKIVGLGIVGNRAWLRAKITRVRSGPPQVVVGKTTYFYAADFGPGGLGDEFLWDLGVGDVDLPLSFCLAPVPGHPITSGNVVIKTTGS
jgi:hypothetical protein